MREAELKHGRICMLAATGVIVQELCSIPGYPGYSSNPIEAFENAPDGAIQQILLFMAICEWNTYGDNYTPLTVFQDPKRKPGDIGFDPLKFGENPKTRERLEMAELKNGRLAMLAFSGMMHQVFVTGKSRRGRKKKENHSWREMSWSSWVA